MHYKQSELNQGIDLRFGTTKRTPQKSNPFVYTHSIPIEIKRYFTDVNGTIVDKNTVPANLKVEYPFAIFGDFDRAGGYNNAFRQLTPLNTIKYMTTFTVGAPFISQNFTGFSGVNDIKDRMTIGDIVHLFADSDQNPNYFIWIVIKNRYASIASIVGNSETQQRDGLIGKIFLDQFNYSTDNENEQWRFPIWFLQLTNIGTYGANQVQPYIFKTPYNEQETFITVKCSFPMDQFLTVMQYFYFATELIQWNFKIRVFDNVKSQA